MQTLASLRVVDGHLDASRLGLPPGAWATALEALPPGVCSLSLEGNTLDEEATTRLAAITPNLRFLDVSATGLGRTCVEALAAAVAAAPGLEALLCARNALRPAQAAALLAAARTAGLLTLDLAGNELPPELLSEAVAATRAHRAARRGAQARLARERAALRAEDQCAALLLEEAALTAAYKADVDSQTRAIHEQIFKEWKETADEERNAVDRDLEAIEAQNTKKAPKKVVKKGAKKK